MISTRDLGDIEPDATLVAGVNLVVDKTTARVVDAMARSGIHTVVLKGPSLGRWLFGGEPPRFSTDVDLLVSPSSVPAAETVLAGLGFLPPLDVPGGHRPLHARTWAGSEHDVAVDLHWTLVGIQASPELVWTVLSRETERAVVCGTVANILTPAGRALNIVLHAAAHGERDAKTLPDLEQALESLPEPLWRAAADLARDLDAGPAFAAGLAMRPAGRPVLRSLGLAPTPSVEVALRARTAPQLALGVEWLARIPTPAAKLRYVLAKLVPSPPYMRSWSPLARRHRLGLALAYAWRPLWVAWHFPRALLAWLRARRYVDRA